MLYSTQYSYFIFSFYVYNMKCTPLDFIFISKKKEDFIQEIRSLKGGKSDRYLRKGKKLNYDNSEIR